MEQTSRDIFKGTVHTKIKILSLFTHPHVILKTILKLYDTKLW